jgi:hypothetical protein
MLLLTRPGRRAEYSNSALINRLDLWLPVPACGQCNNGASDDDEVFRIELSIMASSFGESIKAGERLQPTNEIVGERGVNSFLDGM